MKIQNKVEKIIDRWLSHEGSNAVLAESIHLLYQKEMAKEKKGMIKGIKKMMKKSGLIDGEKASDRIDDCYNEALRDVIYLLSHKKLDKEIEHDTNCVVNAREVCDEFAVMPCTCGKGK